MAEEMQIEFCIYCHKTKLKVAAKKRYCINCIHRKKGKPETRTFTIQKEATLETLDLSYIEEMIYCFYCGEEVIREDGSIICIDGCENLLITEEFCIYASICLHSLNYFNLFNLAPSFHYLWSRRNGRHCHLKCVQEEHVVDLHHVTEETRSVKVVETDALQLRKVEDRVPWTSLADPASGDELLQMKQKRGVKGDELLHMQEKLASKHNEATPQIADEQETSKRNKQEQSEDGSQIKCSKQKVEGEQGLENLEGEKEAAESARFTNADELRKDKNGDMQKKSEELASKPDPGEGQEQQRANCKGQGQAENQTLEEDKHGQHEDDKDQSEAAENQTLEEDKLEDAKGRSEAAENQASGQNKQGQHEDDKGQSDSAENPTLEEDKLEDAKGQSEAAKNQTLEENKQEQHEDKSQEKLSSDNSEVEEDLCDSESSQNENDELLEKENKLKRKKSNESSVIPSSEKTTSANQKQWKSKRHGSIEETAADETEFTVVGEEQVPLISGKKPVLSYPPALDALKKYSKTLGKRCKDLGEQLKVNEKKSFDALMRKWKKDIPVPYTWDTFLSALRTIGETTVAEEIESKLVGFPEKNSALIISKTRVNAQQEEIKFQVVLDVSAWSLEKEDQFKLTLTSQEVNNGQPLSYSFKCDLQFGNVRLYSCTLFIPDACMWNAQYFRYKYVVILKNGETQFENLDYSYRVLKKGAHIQYDAEIKPSASNFVYKFFTKKPYSEAVSNALSLYIDWAIIEGWICINSDAVEADISENTKKISQIFNNLCHPLGFLKGKVTQLYEEQSVSSSAFKILLEKLSSHLKGSNNLDKFLSGLIVVDLLFFLNFFSERNFHTDENFSKNLAKSLHLPESEFPKGTSILSKFSPEFRNNIICPVVISLCNSFILKKGHEWIGILPLLHAIKLYGFSFGKPYKLFNATDKVKGICDFKNVFCGIQVKDFYPNESRFALSIIQPYFKHDWLMSRAFVLLCPYKDMFIYSRDYPEMVPLICWKVGYICLDEIAFTENDEIEELTRGLQCLINPLRQLDCSKEEIKLCFKGANKIVRKFVNESIADSTLFRASVQLFLTVLDKFQALDDQGFLETSMKQLSGLIFRWMEIAHGQNLLLGEIMLELGDWSSIYSFSQKNFITTCNSVLSQRLSKIDIEKKTNILSTSDLHPEVTSALLNSILQSVKDIEDKESSEVLASLKGGSPTEVSQILGAILSSMYPTFIVSFASLFTTSWVITMEIYYETILVSTGPLSTQEEQIGRSLCEQARNYLHNFFKDLASRQITPSQIEDIQNAGEIPKTLEIVKDFLLLRMFSDFKVTAKELEKEIRSYKSFTERNKKLQHFAHTFSEFSEEEATRIKQELKNDYTRTPVNLLWQYIGDEVTYKFCHIDIPQEVIEEVFRLTNHEEISSKVFAKVFLKWKGEYLLKHKNSTSNFKDAVEELWRPMFKEFKKDLGLLHNGLQLPLKKVEYLFNDISDKVTLNKELKKWCCAVNEPDENWIRDAAQKILDYQELCRYSYSAQTLMQLKKTLGLTGDFNAIEALLPKEGLENADDVTLATVESTAAETADILKDIADVPHRRACLETFCSCMSLVEWVRSVALNLGQLQNVVQVANQTMDGDLVKQLLQDLLKFGSAFAPLIYEVDQKESCEALINRCKAMWPLIDERQNLMKITASCTARLGELKRVEESLSDFQKSNVEQMDSINTRGIYYIEAIPGRIIHSPDDAVCLRMRLAQDQTEQQKIFRLDDLRELQSKLVLVAAENADKVNKFIETLSKIEGIALLLIQLQEAGLMDYTHFHLVCGCSEYKKSDFDATIDSMDKDLKNWQKSVEKYRKQYPHLNYYTSQQLLDLRKELGKLKKNPESVASHSLKQLLLSVTPNPSNDHILSSLHNAVKTMNKNMTPLGMPAQNRNIFANKSALPAFDLGSLSDERKEVLKALRDDYEFKISLILAAFSELEEDADEDEVREWCEENEHKYKDEEDVELSTIMNVDTDEEDAISEDNPLVLELLEEEYSLEIAIEAVRKAKQNLQIAREIASDLHVGRYTEANPTNNEHEWSATKYSQVPLSVKMEVEKGEYLDFVELGEFLKELAYQEVSVSFEKRHVHSTLVEEGKINLLAIDAASTWKALLFLYMADQKKPLPTHEEVLICTRDTTVEEVTLLWHRAVNDEEKKRLFCLVNADQLPFSVSEKALDNLEVIIQGSKNFRIVVLINAKDQARNHLASRLSLYLRKFPKLPSDDDIAKYISAHIDLQVSSDIKASSDQERQTLISLNKNVHIVASRCTGMGKTLRVKRMAEMITTINSSEKPSYVNVPIHGPEVSVRHVLELMEECKQDPTDAYPQLIHFNIAQDMIEQIDWLLFKIIVLGGLDDEHGNIWRRVEKQVCVVECTLTKLDLESSDDMPSEEVLPSVYSLLSYFPQTICELPNKVQDNPKSNLFVSMDEHVFKEESVQRVYQYLRRMKANQDLDQFKLTHLKKPEGTGKECLECLLEYTLSKSIEPSWSDIRNFIQFLNAHLYDCEQSPYCSVDDFKGFKKFIVKFSILMAKEFTEPSISDSVKSQNDDISKKWDACSHPYLFFNQDGYTMTFLGLWVDEDGNLLDYNNKQVIEHKFMDKTLRNVLHHNAVCFQEDYRSWDKQKMILKLIRVLGIPEIKKGNELDLEKIDSDSTYVLTVDNLMKMLAIHMKFRCGIPVIMIGETGCGKTRLLRYLCEMQDKAFKSKTLICLKVHGGINADRIYSEVESAAKLAIENKGKCNYTVLFFDEVNTTEALGLIKEVICDRTLNGKAVIPEELKFAAACNPYRIHDDETIKSLQKAGLGFYLKDGEKTPKLGQLPLRKLVYRVLPLPESMYRYVYDFGTVTGKTENEYIEKIVKNQLSGCKCISSQLEAIQTFVEHVLCECQAFMREQKNECKYVSLRDVVRAMILFKWFLEKLCSVDIIKKKLTEQILNDETIDQDNYQELNDITRALIYSVSVCYYARLTDREPFLERIIKCFINEYKLPGSTDQENISFFVNEINRIQNVFLIAMNIPSNIAHNAALRENIFMMVVCIENRLPLFIVGKPGSSKSLAKSIVSNSMQGRYSSNELLQHLKQVQIFPYQCNQFSTTKSLIDVFEEAMNFQKSQDTAKFASVVVLEEIGLAEDAPGLPLKVLHPYLEDGTSGADPYAMDIKPEERVAFIGISNWALDPAKMNRGIMVTRCPPEPQELIKSAYGIANMVKDDNLRSELTKSFDALAEMYQKICVKQEEGENSDKDEAREFFGLRDFYTLIKMICWKCIDKDAPPSSEDYRRIILRNFSGHTKIDPLEELPNPDLLIEMKGTESEALEIVKESVQPLKIQTNEDLPKQENRYLLYITENQSALQILQNKLLTKDEKLFVFYGSSFPKDTEYTQVCVNINKIKVCMEKGIPVVLLNYEQIYESLYDVLNQCYTELPTGRYVDLGLRSYRIKCRVDPNFRLIIIAERDRVFKQFPAALINRLEKHFVVSNTILTPQQKVLAKKIRKWVDEFANVEHNGKRFLASDSFVGFQEDTPSSVVLHVSNIKEQDEKEVYNDSIAFLLQTASIDAVTRLKSNSAKCDTMTKDWAFRVFFEEQQHFSMIQFLFSAIEKSGEDGAMIQITTFGPLLTQNYIATLAQGLGINSIKIFQLSDFHTEMDFSNDIKTVYASEYEEKKLLIVQCEYGEKKTDLIACARHRLMDEGQRITISGVTHVVFIIQLPRVAGGTSFASFQGGSWICTHIDELTCHSGVKQVLQCAISEPLHKFFHMLIEKKDEVPDEFNVGERVRDNVQVSVSMIISVGTYQQMEYVIELLLQLISNNFNTQDVSVNFTSCLLMRIEDLLQQRDDLLPNPNNWAIDAAMDRSKLQASFTLVNSIKKAIDTQLQRILAYIISCINKNNNLNLLKSDNGCLKILWVSLFSNSSFLPFDYDTIATTTIPSININGRNYSCKFPFSWEIIDQVNAAFGTVLHKSGLNEGDKQKTFQDLVESTTNQAFVKHVEKLPSEDALLFYNCYLHDFIKNLVLPFSEEAIESVHEILFKVLREIVIIFEPLAASEEPFPLINTITAVHLAYSIIEQEIFWLAELSEGLPELPNILKDRELLSSGKTVFHFKAVECVIDQILPHKVDWKDDEAVNYFILNFHSSKSAVETILYLKGHDDISTELLLDLRSKWQALMSIVLFAEHIIAPLMPNITLTTSKFTILKRYSNVVRKLTFSEPKILMQSIRQIQGILKALPVQEQANCQLCKSTLKVTDIIYIPCEKSHMFCEKCFNDSVEKRGPRCPSCDTPIPRKRAKDFSIPENKRKEYEQLKQVQQYCLDFFMELVSQCCFSPIAPENPTDDFYKALLGIVTDTAHEDYKNLFPFEEDYTHGCPIARSVLLQLLLEYNPIEVQKKLQEYQNYVKKTFGSEYITDDQELTLLCIKSLEDGLHKTRAKKECIDDELNFGIQCLNDALTLLTDGDHFKEYQDNLSVEFMQCIANVRFGMCFAVDIFHQYYCFGSDKRNQLPRVTKEKLEELHKSIQDIIGKGVLKEPHQFFVKQFVRRFGFPYLSELGKLAQFKWLNLEKTETFDGFVVCGKEYTTLRAKWIFTTASFTENDLVEDLEKDESKTIFNKIASSLVFYRHIASDSSNTTALGHKDLFCSHQKTQKLLSHVFNDGYFVTAVIFNPREPKTANSIAAVVVQWISVLETRIDSSLFAPFKDILLQTANAKEMYWPTMDDNILDIVVDATAGTTDTWWKCPNGHDYFVQNCGRQVVGDVQKCFCGAEIGGKSYNVAKEGNVKIEKSGTELTKTGHVLDHPNARSTDPVPQRDLSPFSNCIIRFLVNATCVWIASSNNKAACQMLFDVTLTSEPIELHQLLNYFWHHLELDIQTLRRATQHSFDDCILLLHTIVHNMLRGNYETIIDFDIKLLSRKDRQCWENKFNQIVIKPNIEVQTEKGKDYLIDQHIERGRQLIIEDSNLDHRALLQMVYETVPITSNSIMPHLWIYRPLITIDHVSLSLEKDTESADLRILRQFLKQVKLLEALACLPDIIRLQQFLYEMCHLRIDETEVDQSLEEYIRKGLMRTHKQQKLLAQAENLCTAWNKVKNELPSLMSVAVPKECISVEMSLKQPLEFFIPMRQGKGVCSLALTSYLAKLQNDFIDFSWEKLKVKSIRGKRHIPSHKIQDCHMISFKDQLSHVIFSHCKYSLKAGHGADIKYDFPALEKHILDRFVRGRPLITCDIPLVSYRSDVLDAVIFRQIRRNIPQENLPQREKAVILNDLQKTQRVQQCIDTVNVALGFIQHTRSNSQLLMKRFMSSLKMEGKLPKLVEERCELRHAISLWRLVNVEQAKQITNGNEDPFPNINDVFKERLDDKLKEVLQIALGTYDMDQFLEVFYEFIVTQVKSRREYEADDELIEAYIDVCDYFDLERITSFAEKFPKEFSLKHVTEIWKYAVKYQREQIAKQL